MHLEYIHRVCLDLNPNIEGSIGYVTSDNAQDICDGAFTVTETRLPYGGDVQSANARIVRFRASDANAIFSGINFRLNALSVLCCIKT